MTSAPLPVFRRSLPVVPAVLLGALVVAMAVYWLAGSIAEERYRDVFIAAVVVQVGWVFVRWRMSVYLFMTYVVVEGFLVNYFYQIPELNLLKDTFTVALFGSLALQLAAHRVFPVPRTLWSIPFYAFAGIYLLQVFNPSLPNILVGLVGVRANLLFFLLTPVAFWFFNSRQRVLHFFQFMFWLSIPVSAFGIFQYFAGPAFMVSLSPGFARAVFFAFGLKPTPGSTYFRTFSTFVQTGSFGTYLGFVMLVSVALWTIPALRRFRPWILGGFVVQLTAMFTTGSRAPFVLFLFALAMTFALQRRVARLAPVILLIPLILWGSILVVGPGFVERFGSLMDLDFVQNRNLPLIQGWLAQSMEADWAGLGAGYASVSSRHVGETALNVNVVENGLAKVRFEGGLPGLVFYSIFVIALMIECVRAPQRTTDKEMRPLLSACSAFLFANLINIVMGTPFDVSPSNVYIWFFAGLLARASHFTPGETHDSRATAPGMAQPFPAESQK